MVHETYRGEKSSRGFFRGLERSYESWTSATEPSLRADDALEQVRKIFFYQRINLGFLDIEIEVFD